VVVVRILQVIQSVLVVAAQLTAALRELLVGQEVEERLELTQAVEAVAQVMAIRLLVVGVVLVDQGA
jgi:hypothetical protein